MKLFGIILLVLAISQTALSAPLIKSMIITLGADEPIETAAYDVASVGASFVVDHTGLFGPLINIIPGSHVILGAAQLFGGKFAGKTVGGVASKKTQGFLEGEAGNNIPLIGWIIRNEDGHE
ncbi:hypothetical protein H4S08_000343 [Coemansia sp. RSA 1365]|nr:hypothetical protein H4S08_000343 [Coemansia sp. RSA 1365]